MSIHAANLVDFGNEDARVAGQLTGWRIEQRRLQTQRVAAISSTAEALQALSVLTTTVEMPKNVITRSKITLGEQ